MRAVEIISIIIFCVGEIVILYFAFIGGKFLKTLFLNALFGVGLLAVLKGLEAVSGIFIPINQYTVAAAGTMGIPSVIVILILRFIFL